jgi:NitT/TauT family transport system substrate-binding protein
MQSISSGFCRRTILKTTGAAAVLSGLGVLVSVTARSAGLVKVDMQLGWLVSNGLLGEIVAKRKGFFAEEGIEFSITPGGPNVDGVASVAAGRSSIGQLSSSPSLMVARSAGIPVKAIASGYHKHPYTYFSLRKNPITRPADMIGKKIGVQPTGQILLRALLAKNSIPEADVTVVNVGSDMAPLMTGQVDAVTGWQTNVAALKVMGEERTDLMLWDTGIRLYANVYYATDATLAEHADVLAKFIAAAARGWGYAKEHPEEAVDLLVSEAPNLDRANESEALPKVIEFSFGKATKERGWGQMTAENWQEQIDIYAKLGQFKGVTPAVDDVMTIKILNMTEKTRKEMA